MDRGSYRQEDRYARVLVRRVSLSSEHLLRVNELWPELLEYPMVDLDP